MPVMRQPRVGRTWRAMAAEKKKRPSGRSSPSSVLRSFRRLLRSLMSYASARALEAWLRRCVRMVLPSWPQGATGS
jgi:hypothetical protein